MQQARTETEPTSQSKRAAVFDLFGTLIDLLPDTEWQAVEVAIARMLGLPVAEYEHLYRVETYRDRNSGTFRDIEENIAHICQRLGVAPNAERVAEAARLLYDFQRERSLIPRPDTISTLTTLRERGYKIGLISDCAPDVPLLWPELPFAPLIDVAVFSCVARAVKPDQRLYAQVTRELGVAPEHCVYVGDNIHELEGAERAGMTPYRILTPAQAALYADRDAWPGAHLAALGDLLPLLG